MYVVDFIHHRQNLELEREEAGYADSYNTIKKQKSPPPPDPQLENKKKLIWKEQKEKTCEELVRLKGLTEAYLKIDTKVNINEFLRRK
jgi:hypothetical protein